MGEYQDDGNPFSSQCLEISFNLNLISKQGQRYYKEGHR